MLKCPNCGKLNNPASKFCKYCGTKLTNVKPVSSASNKVHCPNCGTVNNVNNKFCVRCGYQLNGKALNSRQVQQNPKPQAANPSRYQNQWRQANQSISAVSNYSNDYFKWFKDTLIHPMGSNRANPYFGLISFGLIAVFIWIAEILGKDSSAVNSNISDLVTGNSPLQIYINNWQKAETPVGMFILAFVSIAIYVLAACIGRHLMASSSTNVLSDVNQMAGFLNVAVILSLILLIGALMNLDILTYYLDDLIDASFTIGTAYLIITTKNKRKSLLNSIYMAIIVCVCAEFLQSIFAIIVGTMA